MRIFILLLSLILSFSPLLSEVRDNQNSMSADSMFIKFKSGQTESIPLTSIKKIQFENITGIEEQTEESFPIVSVSNYPNPFSEGTSIEFEINHAGIVEIVISNNSGQHIQTLKCENCQPGMNTLQWDCLDGTGSKVPEGVYYYEVRFGEVFLSKKMIIVR